MELSQSRVGQVPVIEVRGEVDHSSSRLLGDVSNQALGEGNQILLDLKECPYMDSGGIAVLLSLLLKVRPEGWLGVIAASPDLLRIFSLVGLTTDKSFRSFDTRDEATQIA